MAAPKKKKKRSAEGAQTSDACDEGVKEAEKTSAGEAAVEKSKKRKRNLEVNEEPATKHKKEAASTSAGTDEHEEKRRRQQKDIQELVVRLRKEGKSEKEIKAAKLELKLKQGSFSKPDGHRAKKAEEWKEWISSSDARQTIKENRTKQHELVVIPVVWRGRMDKEDVMQAAEDIKACVAQQGVDVWVDARRHYKPGQKFAHWEHRGVMLRVEIGPDDIKAGVCRVCRAKTPGDFQSVERKRVRLPPIGARTLLLALKEWGLSQIEIERRDGDSADEEEAAAATADAPAGAARAASAQATLEEDDVQGNWAPASSGKKAKKDKKVGGKKM